MPVAESDPEARSVPHSLFDGVEEAACSVLEISCLRHRSVLHVLGKRDSLPSTAVAAVLGRIADNWKHRKVTPSPSSQNWRWWTPQPFIGRSNRSPEVVLERAVARASIAADRRDWSNQVPVASGVMASSGERRRAIDLIEMRGPGHFAFIELKVVSDTPLSAAIQIIGYVGAWLLARQSAVSPLSDLLAAHRIDARVLAPASYYAPFALGVLEQTLDRELAAYGTAHGVELSFGFDRLPDSFAIQPDYDDAEVAALLGGRRPL